MSTKDMVRAFFKMVTADPSVLADMQAMAAEPTVTRKPAKGKRTLTDEQKQKMADGRKAAQAARAAATAKPAPAPVVAATKPAKVKGKGRKTFGPIGAGVGQKAKNGRVYVPLWVNGEYVCPMRADVARELFVFIRSAQAGDLLSWIESQG
jgi:hypothetical protein